MLLRKRQGAKGVSWIIDYNDHDGKRKRYVLKDIKDKKSAELAFAEFRLKFEHHQLDLPTEENLTLDAALDAMIKDRKRNGCMDDWISCLENMRTNVTNDFGKDRLFKSLNDDAMARYRDHRLKKTSGLWKWSTRNSRSSSPPGIWQSGRKRSPSYPGRR